MKKRTMNTRTMTELALLAALVLVMAYTPLGYLPVGPLTMSLLTIPVAVGAMLLGPGGGALLGGVFGATSFMQAMRGTSAMGAALFAVNPALTFVTCFGARVLMGFLAGLIYKALTRLLPGRLKICCTLGGLCTAVCNTVCFMGALVLFFYGSDYVQSLVQGFGVTNPLAFVVALVGVQGAVEAVLCAAVSGAVTAPVIRYVHKAAPHNSRLAP